MTTIIVDTEKLEIWADSQTTSRYIDTGYESFLESMKIHEIIEDGERSLVASAGDSEGSIWLIHEVLQYGNIPQYSIKTYDNIFIMVHPSKFNKVDILEPTYKKLPWYKRYLGKYSIDWKITQVKQKYKTIGSGASYAEAFLSVGYSPEQAIKLTSKLDRWTNDSVICDTVHNDKEEE